MQEIVFRTIGRAFFLTSLFLGLGCAQTYRVLYDFSYSTTVGNFDGENPESTLTLGSDGNFYGTALYGGPNGVGTVFKITPSGILTTLHSFSVTDGAFPQGPLTLGNDGNFYGTTTGGAIRFTESTLGNGTVFKITPAGQFSTLYAFCPQPGCSDGSSPFDGVTLGLDGNFYGTTTWGGNMSGQPIGSGTIFQITPAGAFKSLYSFCSQTGCPDGLQPTQLTLYTDGSFYGMTESTIFKFTPGGTLSTLYSCTQTNCPGIGGAYNLGAGTLTLGNDGNFYGTAGGGLTGANCGNGCGTLIQVTPSGLVTTLHNFCSQSGCADGFFPNPGLTLGSDGYLYGTTFNGGTGNLGIIYKTTTTGTLSVLVSYDFANYGAGVNPIGGLTLGPNGDLYGTTALGGVGDGLVYTISSFNACTPGSPGCAAIELTSSSNPSAFQQAVTFTAAVSSLSGSVSPTGSVAFSDAGVALGSAALVNDKASVTAPALSIGPHAITAYYSGDTNFQPGTAGLLEVVCAVTAQACTATSLTSSLNPAATGEPVTFTATVTGVASSTTPTGSVAFADGGTPLGSVALAGGTASFTTAALSLGQHSLTASYGGDNNFQASSSSLPLLVNPAFTTLLSFGDVTPVVTGSLGNSGDPALVESTDGSYYGTTQAGGLASGGSVFKVNPLGGFTTIYSFCEVNPAPTCFADDVGAGLVLGSDGNFYGTTRQGGDFNYGTIYKVTPGGIQSLVYSFCTLPGCADGANPQDGLVQGSDGDFYGTTSAGGASTSTCGSTGCGTVFKFTPGGTVSAIYTFCKQTGCPDGFAPYAGLIQATDGDFYGTTTQGGTPLQNPFGTVYKVNSAGSLITLHSFNGLDGSGSTGARLVQGNDGNFYGVTENGGSTQLGTVFQMTPAGVLTTIHSFCPNSNGTCTDGEEPTGGLVRGTDGNFYGITSRGGYYGAPAICTGNEGCGTIFRITPNRHLTTLHAFQGTDGGYPLNALLQATNGDFYGITNLGGDAGQFCKTCGTIFSLYAGLGPFVKTTTSSGAVGASVTIIGASLSGVSHVSFNGTPAAFQTLSPYQISAVVPAGATTGPIQVTTPSGTLSSNTSFQVTPAISKFSPQSGPVGTVVTIVGESLTGATGVWFGAVKAVTFTVVSDTRISVTVPAGATTGKITVATRGGTARSAHAFVVN